MEPTEHTPEQNEPSATPSLNIDKWVYGGAGLGRWNGQVALAPFTLPGETVQFTVQRKRPDLLHVRATSIEVPSLERVPAPCPYFERCGGCHYQHAPYEFQLARKREILAEVLHRVGKIQPPADIQTVSGEPWAYRNRCQLHIANGQIGFHAAESHQVVPIDKCAISSPRLNETITIIRRMMKDRRWPPFIRSIELFTNESETLVNVADTDGGKRVARSFFDWCAAGFRGGAAGDLSYTVGQDRYRVSHGSFFQVNRFLVEPLLAEALGDVQGATALDLYAGVGLFTIPLARRFQTVDAVESSAHAVRDLAHNATTAGVTVNAHRANAEAYLENLINTPDFVLADPPRAGLGTAAVAALLRLAAPRLTIVSCDPSTLARDLRRLLDGGYQLTRLTLVDLFPQTYHIESVAHLSR